MGVSVCMCVCMSTMWVGPCQCESVSACVHAKDR